MNEADFLAAFAANPTDHDAWFLYADWLEEHGDNRAAIVRKMHPARESAEERTPPSSDWQPFEQALSMKQLVE